MINDKEKNFVSIVAYIRNNESTLEHFLKTIYETMENSFAKYELILVDDASEDKSVERIKSISRDFNCVVNIIKMSYYQGVEKGLTAGTDLAIGDYVYEFENINVDYESKLILDAYYKVMEGNDIVNACPITKEFKTKFFYQIYNMSVNNYAKISSVRFRILSRRAINRIANSNQKIPYRKAALAECGLKTASIKYKPTEKLKNHQKKDTKSVNQTAFESLLIFTDALTKVSIIFCVFFFLFGFASLTHILISDYLAVQLSSICFCSFGFGILSIILTCIIHYISILVYSQFKKTEYVVEGIEKVNKN